MFERVFLSFIQRSISSQCTDRLFGFHYISLLIFKKWSKVLLKMLKTAAAVKLALDYKVGPTTSTRFVDFLE